MDSSLNLVSENNNSEINQDILHPANSLPSTSKSLIRTMIVKNMDNLNILNNPKSVITLSNNSIISKIKIGLYDIKCKVEEEV